MSARIEDVLAEHETIVAEDNGQGVCICDGRWPWDDGDLFGGHRKHIADELVKAGFGDVARARKDALLEAAEAMDDLPGCSAMGYYSSYEHAGYSEATRHAERLLLKRAEDSPAPVTCQECGETVRHSACSHEKDICPGCVGKCFHCVAEMESA